MSEITSQEMEEQWLQMFEPSMEERVKQLEEQVRDLERKLSQIDK